jgi:hypothetical protein
MDVLIVERDELIAAVLAEALADDCITASIAGRYGRSGR